VGEGEEDVARVNAYRYVVRRHAPEVLRVDQFHAKSSPHRPVTEVRLTYDTAGIHVRFDVQDRYVRCLNTGPVCQDACVEWFVSPRELPDYFNFEINCGGALLLNYRRAGVKHAAPASWRERLKIRTSLPAVVEPEIVEPVNWWVEFTAPFALFEEVLGPAPRTVWRANFYKCASNNSHPHWASWAPVGEKLSFHQPQSFGELVFAP
jgi:hypothetical protein